MATEDSGRVLKLNAGSWYLPKRNTKRPKGEDAHFICSDKNTIGLADGVGSWSEVGVDAGKYSRCLMLHAKIVTETMTGEVHPLRVLEMACGLAKLARTRTNTEVRGSSTACIIALNGESLDYANLGDSGLMVFRDNKMIHRSPVQVHRFNYPYQVGCGSSHDDPGSAYVGKVAVKQGDIIVAGTDGLFDNMWPDEVWEILEQHGCSDPKILARIISRCAHPNSYDLKYDSPFAQAAREAGVVKHGLGGGKVDDITVIVAKVELGTRILQHKDPELSFNIRAKDLLKLKRSLTIHGIPETVREDKRYSLVDENGELFFFENQPIKVIESESSVKPILSAAEVPMCVRGIYKKKLESILKSGLNRNQRSHVHFSCSPPTGKELKSGVGYVDVLIHLDIKKALEEGMKLYIREDGVILTEGFDGVVPVKFFEKIESWPFRKPIVF